MRVSLGSRDAMTDFTRNMLKGLALALFVATGFSAWVTFLRLTVGTAPFDRLDTTYQDVVLVYYAGGFSGGILLGLLWPLRRWVLGSALLGVVGVFPMYYGFAIQQSPRSEWLAARNLWTALLLSLFVGTCIGTGIWLREHPRGPNWVDTLRYPTSATVRTLWLVALATTVIAWFIGLRWAGKWPAAVALVLFIVPLGFAIGVSVVAARRNSQSQEHH